jgi:hypothetical protein
VWCEWRWKEERRRYGLQCLYKEEDVLINQFKVKCLNVLKKYSMSFKEEMELGRSLCLDPG